MPVPKSSFQQVARSYRGPAAHRRVVDKARQPALPFACGLSGTNTAVAQGHSALLFRDGKCEVYLRDVVSGSSIVQSHCARRVATIIIRRRCRGECPPGDCWMTRRQRRPAPGLRPWVQTNNAASPAAHCCSNALRVIQTSSIFTLSRPVACLWRSVTRIYSSSTLRYNVQISAQAASHN